MRHVLLKAVGGVLVAGALLATSGAQDGRDPRPLIGVSAPSVDVELAFTIDGRVIDVLVDPGDVVDPGRALVRLDDREVAASERLLRLRAESTLAVDAAEAELKLAENEEARVRDAFEKRGAAAFEVDRAELQTRQRRIALLRARERALEAHIQLDQMVTRREQFTLAAPTAGVVEAVMVEVGETVDRLRPVVRIVSVDPMWVEVSAPLDALAGVRVGDRAQVSARAAAGVADPVLVGEVIHVAMVADAASGTRAVRIEAPNPGGIPAGARVEVRILSGDRSSDARSGADS